ncbi:MAG: hypothetical protein KAS63_09975 [Candidatus Heimdallarchaeota archaeon]|nr:hypothetical protein [Candidatus Heimdallarchaeota archaeon]MCK4955679.1 hypothetical protein [Candidatus Heimdallarchaeota archaeon]
MEKELLPLEERVKKLESEIERLRRIIESHVRDHGFPPPIHPDPTKPPKRPFEPGHPDVGKPKTID